MNPSSELIYQAEQFAKTRSFSLDMKLKNELGKIYYELGHGVLNKNCSTCVRIAMDRLNAELAKQGLPRLIQPVHFIGIKMDVFNPEQMKYQDLRKFVKNKGIKTEKNPSFEDLIKLLKE